MRTISLDGIVSNPAEHRELGVLIKAEALTHPGEEVGQTVMSTSHTLGNTRASTRER